MSHADPPDAAEAPAAPKRELTLFDSTCIIVGIIIGAGIYRTTPDIAGCVPDTGWLIAVWLLGGLVALVGAVCYAELATAYPRAGGDYVYLTRAFDRPIGFLFAWSELWVVRPGSIGVMAFAFGEFANQIWPRAEADAPAVHMLYAFVAILALTAVNAMGVRQGKWTQNVLTTAKVIGLLAVIVVGFTYTVPPPEENAATAAAEKPAEPAAETAVEPTDKTTEPPPAPPAPPPAAAKPTFSLGAFGLAMIFVLFTYGGWNEMGYVGAEVRDPRRNIVRALVLGTLVVATIYVVVNLAFIHALGLAGVRKATAAADVLTLALGPWGGWAISLLICISALGAINGQIFTGSRIYYAMGNDHRLYRLLGRWDPKLNTPLWSLVVQATIALGLVMIFGIEPNGFKRMVIFTTPTFWFFLFLVGMSLFVFRAREPDVARPYRVLGYPLTPLLLCLVCLFMLYSSLDWAVRNQSWEAFWAVGITLVGVVASCFARSVPAVAE